MKINNRQNFHQEILPKAFFWEGQEKDFRVKRRFVKRRRKTENKTKINHFYHIKLKLFCDFELKKLFFRSTEGLFVPRRKLVRSKSE